MSVSFSCGFGGGSGCVGFRDGGCYTGKTAKAITGINEGWRENMPPKSERTKVDVKESSTIDVRTFNITLTAPVRDFQLTDLLRQRGVMESLDNTLKRAVKEATEKYLESAEVLISGLITKPSPIGQGHSFPNWNTKPAGDL